jgi:hypothetical protein
MTVRSSLVFGSFILCLSLSLMHTDSLAQSGEGSELAWIWTTEAKGQSQVPAGKRWFRKTFMIDRDIKSGR